MTTLASAELVDELARRHVSGLCIVGKTETENIGIDKVIKNVVSNPTIHYSIVAGRDPAGHRSGQTLLALAANGVDQQMRVLGSLGKRLVLRNVTLDEVEASRGQVRVIDLVGCEDADRIVAAIDELAAVAVPAEVTTCARPSSIEPKQSPEVQLVRNGPPRALASPASGKRSSCIQSCFVPTPSFR